MEAVAEVVTRDGIDALTFAAVAEQAGVGERTVYRHYPSRDSLLDALDAHVEARLELGGFPEHRGEARRCGGQCGNPVIDLLVSATAWERLRRLHGMDGATAGETVARALERLLEDEDG